MLKRSLRTSLFAFLIAGMFLAGCQTANAPAEVVGAPGIETQPASPMPVLSPPATASPVGEPSSTAPNQTQPSTPTEDADASGGLNDPAIPTIYTYEIVNEYPHDPNAFTQGLVYLDGILIEGTGLYGHSSLRKVDLETGEPFIVDELDDAYFGEGVAVFDDTVYQLTWKSQKGFTYNLDGLDPIGTFTYPTEGWGLTHDGDRLIMSDGTSNLYFVDPETFEIQDRVVVHSVDRPVTELNELEYINGEVYANVWQTNGIVRIDPATGEVVGYIDLTGLHKAENQTGGEDVLNGIAYDSEGDRLFVTGKLWPTIYEIKLAPLKKK